MEAQAQFEGWAVVELFGHQKEVGFVSTRYFGTAAMFQIDVPELPEREYELERPDWIGGQLAPAGSKVVRTAVAARSRFVGPSAVYALNPCSEIAARTAIERNVSREIRVISLPEGKQLQSASDEDYVDDGYGEGDEDDEEI